MADADTPPAGWDGGEAHAHDAVSGVQGAPAEGTTSALEANQTRDRRAHGCPGPPRHPFLLLFSPLLVYLSQHVITSPPSGCGAACTSGTGWEDAQPGSRMARVARGTAPCSAHGTSPGCVRGSAWDSRAYTAGCCPSWYHRPRPPGWRSVPAFPRPCQLLARWRLRTLAF